MVMNNLRNFFIWRSICPYICFFNFVLLYFLFLFIIFILIDNHINYVVTMITSLWSLPLFVGFLNINLWSLYGNYYDLFIMTYSFIIIRTLSISNMTWYYDLKILFKIYILVGRCYSLSFPGYFLLSVVLIPWGPLYFTIEEKRGKQISSTFDDRITSKQK